jgi:hypothetical protein
VGLDAGFDYGAAGQSRNSMAVLSHINYIAYIAWWSVAGHYRKRRQ